MQKVSKYKKQIFWLVTIFLLLEFGVYPCLTAADTFSNIIGAVALLVLIVWGALELHNFVNSDKKELSDEEIKQKLESEIGPVIDEMAKEVLAKPKRKSNPKQTAPKGTDESAPFVKTRKKSTQGRKLTLDERMHLWFESSKPNRDVCDYVDEMNDIDKSKYLDEVGISRTTKTK